MEIYIVTIIRNRGEQTPTEEEIKEKIKELTWDNEVYIKKVS